MRFSTLVAFTALLISAAAWANPQSDPAGSGSNTALMPAAWTPKEFNFVYQTGFTTKYSCDGLRDKMKQILLDLGARDDVQVRTYGCMKLTGPDLFPGVHVRMNVLQPASRWEVGKTIPAHWKMVDLLADREVVDAAADCELIEQVRQKIVPLFAARDVDYRATCEKRNVLPGGTQLKAQVLVPAQSATIRQAAR